MNTPYRKQQNKNGELLNPITAEKPFENATPYSNRGKSRAIKISNNRKFSRGRKNFRVPILKITGFIVTAKQVDEFGKPTNNNLRLFSEVINPNYKYDGKLSHRKNVKLRREAWGKAIDIAKKLAYKLAENHKFPCSIIAKIERSDVLVRQN
jgi:hypothetical protein